MPDLQPTQEINLHTIHTKTKAKSTHINKTSLPRDNIMPPVTMFEQNKQIIMNIDMLSHSTMLHNKILQSLNFNGLCKYAIYVRHTYLNTQTNQSTALTSAYYTVTPDTHQWYSVNTNKIADNHNITLCNDPAINMVPLPTAEPSEFNAFKTIVKTNTLRKSKGPT